MTAAPTTTVDLDAVTIDSVALADLTITYGRQSVLEQPGPTALSLTMLTDQAVITPSVGMSITVDSTVGVTTYPRFKGKVTSVAAGRDTTQLTATSDGLGRLARLAGSDFPLSGSVRGAGENINALLTAAGALAPPIGLNLTYSPGDALIVPTYVVPAGSLLSQCQALAGYDTAGVFFEGPDAQLYFTDGTDRPFPNTASPDIYINVALTGGGPSPITLDWVAVQALDGLVNQAVVTYGSPSTSLTVTDGTSVTDWGLFGTSVDYPVVDADDAVRKASRLVANYSQPRTVTNPVVVELTSCSTALQGELLSALVGTSVGWLPGATASGIPGLPEAAFIEGWVERITGHGGYNGRHTMSLTLSDVALTRTMQTWAEVTASLKWNGVGATTTWYQLAGLSL